MQKPQSADSVPFSIPRLIAVALVMRLLIDTAAQMFYPFLPLFAAGLGITAIQMGQFNGLRTIMGLSSPLFGAAAERFTNRAVMRVGLLLTGTGLLIFGNAPSLPWVVVAMVVSGFGFAAFTPTLFAYVSDRLPYDRRARGLGAIELSWALAGIFGLYAVGQLIEITGDWRLPVNLLGGALLLSAVMVTRLPGVEINSAETPTTPRLPFGQRVRAYVDLGDKRRSAYAMLLVSALTPFAALHIISAHGTWLVEKYQLDAGQLGTVSLLLGIAALISNVIIMTVGDRLGKLRSIRHGLAAGIVSMIILPWFDVNAQLAVFGLFLVYFCFEFAIVNSFIVVSEQLPQQRAKMMTLGAAMNTTGLAIGSVTGPMAFESADIVGLAAPAAIGFAIALFLLVRFVRE